MWHSPWLSRGEPAVGDAGRAARALEMSLQISAKAAQGKDLPKKKQRSGPEGCHASPGFSSVGLSSRLGAQHLGMGDWRVCQEGRGGAEETNDVSITPLQSRKAAWDFQPLFAWAAALELACCTRSGSCFMHDLAAAGEGGQSVSRLSGRIALLCLPRDNGKFLRGALLDLGPEETG